MIMKRLTSIAAALLFSSSAQAVVIDFESQPTGLIPEYTVIDGIIFSTALDSGLLIDDVSPQTNGKGLLVGADTNGEVLRGTILGVGTFIEFAFGNDDPRFTLPGDLATLTLYAGFTLVDVVTVALNRDDVMNQTISFTGQFNNFTFAYTNPAGRPFTGPGSEGRGLIEAIDDIRYTTTEVPEPGAWALLLAGLTVIGAFLRHGRHRAAAHVA